MEGLDLFDGDDAVPTAGSIRAAEPQDANRVVVEWLLGSVCNYRCSYCPEELHDGAMRWPKWDTVESVVRRVAAHYQGRRLTFLLTGGEPTLYRRIRDLADLVHDVGGSVAVLSNGSRSIRWWTDSLPHFDEVILSFHREFADRDHFMSVAALLNEHLTVQVNLVVLPEHFADCIAFAHSIQAVAPNARIHRKPLMDHWRSVYGYDETQRQVLLDTNAARSPDAGFPATVLGGDVVYTRADDSSEIRTPIQLLLENENRWCGWRCSAGLETLFIRSVDVYRAACGVGGVLGRIDDDSLVLPNAAVTCTAESCNCIAGVKASKFVAMRGRESATSATT